MRLLLIRHAIAEDAATGQSDAERALTAAGKKKMRRAAAGLLKIVGEIDVLASSPLVRAMQTSSIVSKAYGGIAVAKIDALKPGKPLKNILQWIQGQPNDATLALVGHEPHLGLLTSWLLSAEQRRSFVQFRKGGACFLSFQNGVERGAAILEWMLKPSQLRDLGK